MSVALPATSSSVEEEEEEEEEVVAAVVGVSVSVDFQEYRVERGEEDRKEISVSTVVSLNILISRFAIALRCGVVMKTTPVLLWHVSA